MSKTSEFFNSYSKKYDKKTISKYFKKKHNVLINNLDNINGKIVIDVGCGRGLLNTMLYSTYPDTAFYGIDISSQMIDYAKKNSKGHYCVGNVENIPYENNKFDIVLNTLSFHHYEAPIKALIEMKRILKHGGKIYILDSLRENSLFNPMPKIWDILESKKCYTKHLNQCEFENAFNESGLRILNKKVFYSDFVKHVLYVLEEDK